ncbi:MAG: very short patch repair endonuclease [Planctomycetaceae bacterium]|jgi:DNA mismatch endonuclease (patch repair protein)|nr:very short patch repair endonuclease [Planctomycetaceae bacterium]
MDHLTKEKRSWNMSRIRSQETTPEIIFRKLIHRAGFRYRLYDKTLPGKPDLVLKKHRTVVFIHGCFWHGHKNCERGNRPKTHKNFWNKKIEGNIARDNKNRIKLRKIGWRVFTVWECELKNLDSIFAKFKKFIKSV